MDVYICGLREMVDDLRATLKETGLDRKRIIYEKYD
jgi:CDP-4-dehydro-6-deoxyglucose reductase